jgi:two-component sensor histidine kinase/DNA-binding response OmpR family regulator
MLPDQAGSPPVVLVVEDEIVLRMKAVDIVEDAGFIPVEAANADQAIAILESRSDISLLFSDIQMPGSMDGLKLAHAVHLRWPTIKIILVSGQVTVTDADKPAESRFFGKPLEMKQMISELRTMVGIGALEIVPAVLAPDALPAENASAHQSEQVSRDALTAENGSLRLSLEQAGIDAKALLVQAGIEAEEREAADKLQKLIHEELHHRIKNTLATVSAIATQSLRTATSIAHCQHAIEGRLAALGRAHDMLMRVSWANASLAQTIRSATEPYDSKDGGYFTINGPDVKITSGAVIAFAMTLNELCTNTTKFGALSVPGGSVEIDWVIDNEQQRLRLKWIEKGGPGVTEPTRRSFGTRMMSSLGQQLNGEVELVYAPTGFTYLLDVPLATLTTKAGKVTAGE